MKKDNYSHNIDILRNTVLNYTLLAFSIIGVANFFLVLFRSFTAGFTKPIDIIAQAIATFTIVVLTIYSNRIASTLKILALYIIIIAISTTTFYSLGFMTNAKIYITLFPLFLSFIISFRKAVWVMLSFALIYTIFGILYYTETLTYGFDLDFFATRPTNWLIGIMVVLYSSVSLLYLGNYFNQAIAKNIQTIHLQNQNLAENEKKYRLLFESSHDSIFIIKDKRVIDFNTMTMKVFNCDESYIRNKEPWEMSPEIQEDGQSSKQKSEFLMDKVMQGESLVFDWQHIRPNGEIFDISISLNPLPLDDGLYIQALMRDITDKKRKQAELKIYQQKLESLVQKKQEELVYANEELEVINEELTVTNEEHLAQLEQLHQTLTQLKETQKQLMVTGKMASIGILTSGIAHEINNPVNFISSGVAGLEMEINEIIETITEWMKFYELQSLPAGKSGIETFDSMNDLKQAIKNVPLMLGSIQEGVERTTALVKGLRTFARMDNEIKYPARLSELIESTLIILHNKYHDKIDIIRFYCDDDVINCYPGKLGQLFMNILLNAMQAIEYNGSITISTRHSAREDQFIITISDTGKGIPAEIQHKIFDPFFTTKPIGQGTGLGLAISHGIVKDHHGQIKVTSEVGVGTDFIIILPKG
jgi:PAS domain S-box-containing protein